MNTTPSTTRTFGWRLLKWAAIAVAVAIAIVAIVAFIGGGATEAKAQSVIESAGIENEVLDPGVITASASKVEYGTWNGLYDIKIMQVAGYSEGAGDYPTDPDTWEQLPVAYASSTSCRRMRKLRYVKYGRSRTGLKLWKNELHVRFCYDGRRVQGKIRGIWVSMSVCCWGGALGWDRVEGPRRLEAYCIRYNGISQHNCLVKYQATYRHRAIIRPPIWDGEISRKTSRISMRIYGDGHATGCAC